MVLIPQSICIYIYIGISVCAEGPESAFLNSPPLALLRWLQQEVGPSHRIAYCNSKPWKSFSGKDSSWGQDWIWSLFSENLNPAGSKHHVQAIVQEIFHLMDPCTWNAQLAHSHTNTVLFLVHIQPVESKNSLGSPFPQSWKNPYFYYGLLRVKYGFPTG